VNLSLWIPFCICVAILLVTAAALKAWNAPAVMAKDGLLSSKWVLMAAIGLELAVAVLILSMRDRIAWWLTVGLFSIFIVAASYSIIFGAECNCFGVDRLGAWFTLPVDVCVLAIAMFLRSDAYSRGERRVQLPSVLAMAAIFALAGVGFAEFRNMSTSNMKRLEYLLADEMLAKPWPITEKFHSDLKQLESGKWLLLILRPDCDHCRELVEEHFQDPAWHRPGERTAVFLAGSDEWSFRFDYVSMEPSDTRIRWERGEPFVASPFVVQLSNSIVTQIDKSVKLD
jgi:hypothetical protein